MGRNKIIRCSIEDHLSRYIFVILLGLLMQTIVSQCYSQVRRSGSVAAIEELKNVATQRTETTPIISPMIKPISAQSPSENVKYYERRQQQTTKSSVALHKNAEEQKPEYRNKSKIQMQNKPHSILDEIADAIDLVKDDVPPKGEKAEKVKKLETELLQYVDKTLSKDNYVIFDGIKIEPISSMMKRNANASQLGSPRSARFFGLFESEEEKDNDAEDFDLSVIKKFRKYAKTHALSVDPMETARFFGFKLPQGKSSFLTGFGLGFLAFGLKKLLLPLFLGAQVVKSILIAMFLPSILGSIGKIVGKGLSQFSGSSINLTPQDQMEELDFKDNMGYPTDQEGTYSYPNGDNIGTLPANALYGNNGGNDEQNSMAMSRYGPGGAKVTYLPNVSDNYYRNGQKKQEDFKVFRNIPASSLLLSNYDPFYSPLLSRLDAVFQRLGLGDRSESCRERLVCLMYATPAKYAPYSNLISAQLSRELNELRKPTSDNPEILRFFRYMKSAKEGQEGVDCVRAHPQCPGVTPDGGSAAMITTYNDINKLVSARKLQSK